jgi:hypothetical protein
MFFQPSLDRFVKLRPLRIANYIKVFGLPSPLTPIIASGGTIDARVGGPFLSNFEVAGHSHRASCAHNSSKPSALDPLSGRIAFQSKLIVLIGDSTLH